MKRNMVLTCEDTCKEAVRLGVFKSMEECKKKCPLKVVFGTDDPEKIDKMFDEAIREVFNL